MEVWVLAVGMRLVGMRLLGDGSALDVALGGGDVGD